MIPATSNITNVKTHSMVTEKEIKMAFHYLERGVSSFKPKQRITEKLLNWQDIILGGCAYYISKM